MSRLKSLLAVVAAAVAVSGCVGEPPVPPPEYPGIEQSAGIAIQDLRPATESKGETFSRLITSDAYAIYRTDDHATKPTGLRLLAHRAYETLPELKEQPTIKVQHFVAYANLQSHLRKTSLLAGFTGPVGVALLGPKEYPASEVLTTPIESSLLDKSAGDQEYSRAYYTEQENPEKSPVNLVYIDTEMLGKRIASRYLVPPVKNKPYLYLVEAFDLCIANHLALYQAKGVQSASK